MIALLRHHSDLADRPPLREWTGIHEMYAPGCSIHRCLLYLRAAGINHAIHFDIDLRSEVATLTAQPIRGRLGLHTQLHRRYDDWRFARNWHRVLGVAQVYE